MGRKAKPPRIEKNSDGIWYVHWSESGRTFRQSLRTDDLQKAQTRFAGWLDAKRVVENTDTPTVAFCWNLYLEHCKATVGAPQTTEKQGVNVLAHFGKMRVNEITSVDVNKYVKLRREGMIGTKPAAPATVRAELVKLRACFNYMVRKVTPLTLRLPNTVIPYITLPEDSPPRSRVVLADEQARMLELVKTPEGKRMTRLERFLWIAFETGARRQAILDLTWDRVDFERGTINFLPEGKRQTIKRRPLVPISDRLRPILERAYKERKNGLVFETTTEMRMTMERFCNKHGFKGVSAHTIRHSVATQMAMAGVPMHAIAAILGDTVYTVTKTYTHLQPDWLKDAMTMRYVAQNAQKDSPSNQHLAGQDHSNSLI